LSYNDIPRWEREINLDEQKRMATLITAVKDHIGRPAWICPDCGGLLTIRYVFNPHEETCDTLVQCNSCKDVCIREYENEHYNSLAETKIDTDNVKSSQLGIDIQDG